MKYDIAILKAALIEVYKARPTKYLSKKKVKNKWVYKYKPDSQKGAHELTKKKFEKKTGITDDTHKEQVKKALENGHHVNVLILKDYPDLAEKFGQKNRIEKHLKIIDQVMNSKENTRIQKERLNNSDKYIKEISKIKNPGEITFKDMIDSELYGLKKHLSKNNIKILLYTRVSPIESSFIENKLPFSVLNEWIKEAIKLNIENLPNEMGDFLVKKTNEYIKSKSAVVDDNIKEREAKEKQLPPVIYKIKKKNNHYLIHKPNSEGIYQVSYKNKTIDYFINKQNILIPIHKVKGFSAIQL